MKFVCAVTVLVLASGASGVEKAAPGEVPRPATLSFGYLVGAPTLGITGYAIQELQLTDEHTEMFEASLTRYRNGLYHEFLDTLRHANPNPWDIKDHYDTWIKNDVEKVALFNERVMESVDAVLETDGKKQRFRQIYTQQLLRRGDFDAILRLHDVNLGFKKYLSLHREYRSMRETFKPPPEYLLKYRIVLELVRDSFEEGELDNVTGPEYPGELRARSGLLDASPFYAKPMLLLAHPEIHVELGLSPAQARALSGPLAQSRKLYSEKVAVGYALGGVSDAEMWKTTDGWNKAVSEILDKHLDQQQRVRLHQLAFQCYLRDFEVGKGMKFVGKRYDDKTDPTYSNWVQAESFYLTQIQTFHLGFSALASVLGERRVSKMCGDVATGPSPWHYIDPRKDEDAKKRALASDEELPAVVKKKNRRRKSP